MRHALATATIAVAVVLPLAPFARHHQAVTTGRDTLSPVAATAIVVGKHRRRPRRPCTDCGEIDVLDDTGRCPFCASDLRGELDTRPLPVVTPWTAAGLPRRQPRA